MTLNPRTGNPILTLGSRVLSHGDLVDLLERHGFPASEQVAWLAIIARESGGHPNATVDTRGMTPTELATYWKKPALPEYSVGLFQLNVLARPGLNPETLLDPEENAAAAYMISKGGTDFAPWGGRP